MNLSKLRSLISDPIPIQPPAESHDSHDIEAIAPGLVSTINQLVWQVEAMHDLLCLGLPYNEETYNISFQNVKGMEPELLADRATIQDRQASLMEIYNRGVKK
jgi:hypothetical protein